MAEVMLGLLILVVVFVGWYVIGLVFSAVADVPTNGPGDVFGNVFCGAVTSFIIGALVYVSYMIGFAILHG